MAENFSVYKVISLVLTGFQAQKNVVIRSNCADIVDSVIIRYLQIHPVSTYLLLHLQARGREVHGQQQRAAGPGDGRGQQDADRRGQWGAGQRQALLGRAGAARQDGADAEAGAHRGRDAEHQEDPAESQIGMSAKYLLVLWYQDGRRVVIKMYV